VKKGMKSQVYTFFTKREGGFGRKLALTLLRGEGLDAEPFPTPYAGQVAVIVYGGKRVQQKAERILYSY